MFGSELSLLLLIMIIRNVSPVYMHPRPDVRAHAILRESSYNLWLRESNEFDEVQADITKLEEWSDEQLLQLNPQKCNLWKISFHKFLVVRFKC